MFNEYTNTQSVNIKPACTGMMQKSHPKSYFEWCHVDSRFRKDCVDKNPRVLQIMVFGDSNMLVEILPKDVYDEWVNKQTSEVDHEHHKEMEL